MLVSEALTRLQQFLGRPYAWGGGHNGDYSGGLDCSGLVDAVYGLGGTTYTQVNQGTAVDLANAQPGDLIFFGDPRAPHHVGIYIGNGRMIDAAHTGTTVSVHAIAGYGNVAAVRRVADFNEPAGQVEAAMAKLLNQPVKPAPDQSKIGAQPGVAPGGGATGYGGGVNYGGATPAPKSPAEIKSEVLAKYGAFAWLLNDPEVGPILTQAAQEEWPADKLTAAIQQTDAWRKHSESDRAWNALLATDPATAAQQLAQMTTRLKDSAAALGITISDDRLHNIADQAIRSAWDAQQINDALVGEFHYDPTKAGGGLGLGAIGTSIGDLKSLARRYLLPLDDQTAAGYATRIAQGTLTQNDVQTQFERQAQAMFGNDPGMAAALASGTTPEDYFAPYRSLLAQTLEVSPNSIDWLSSKWSPVISTRDAKSDAQRPMTLTEAAQWARSQPEYRQTAQANDQADKLDDAILRTFGAVA